MKKTVFAVISAVMILLGVSACGSLTPTPIPTITPKPMVISVPTPTQVPISMDEFSIIPGFRLPLYTIPLEDGVGRILKIPDKKEGELKLGEVTVVYLPEIGNNGVIRFVSPRENNKIYEWDLDDPLRREIINEDNTRYVLQPYWKCGPNFNIVIPQQKWDCPQGFRWFLNFFESPPPNYPLDATLTVILKNLDATKLSSTEREVYTLALGRGFQLDRYSFLDITSTTWAVTAGEYEVVGFVQNKNNRDQPAKLREVIIKISPGETKTVILDFGKE